jgi:uncharacterized protein (DUF924 family)
MDKKILDEVHQFWFGELKSPDDHAEGKKENWFKKSDEFDETIRSRFGAYLDEAAATEWDLPSLSRTQQVGLVILLDQFPRNVFRTTGQAFAYDERARQVARALIALGSERLYPVERSFVYMPFMHSEKIRDQDECVALIARETLSASEGQLEGRRSMLDYAFWHRDLIRKFGRFPHRNQMLGRESTEKEEKHLTETGRGY